VRYSVVKTVAPIEEPVTLVEAKEHLRVDGSLEDDYISALISAARDRAENYCNRFFTETQATIVYYGTFPEVLRLPYPDLVTVDSITYKDLGDNQQSLTGYTFDPQTQIVTYDGLPQAKTFKVDVSAAPPLEFKAVKQAILMTVADLYETRVEHIVGTSIALNRAVKVMLYPYRVELGI